MYPIQIPPPQNKDIASDIVQETKKGKYSMVAMGRRTSTGLKEFFRVDPGFFLTKSTPFFFKFESSIARPHLMI